MIQTVTVSRAGIKKWEVRWVTITEAGPLVLRVMAVWAWWVNEHASTTPVYHIQIGTRGHARKSKIDNFGFVRGGQKLFAFAFIIIRARLFL